MGQKVNPISFRLGIVENWQSTWFAKKKDFANFLQEDIFIRKFIDDRFSSGGITKVEIERVADSLRIKLHTARPGIVIGRKGVEIDRINNELRSLLKRQVIIDVLEVENPALDAQFVAQTIANQVGRNFSFRYVVKRTIQTTMQSGGKGIKVRVSGRLSGTEIARSELYKEGRNPLHTLRAIISYGYATARTTYGAIGIKVWIYRGEGTNKDDLMTKSQIPNKKISRNRKFQRKRF